MKTFSHWIRLVRLRRCAPALTMTRLAALVAVAAEPAPLPPTDSARTFTTPDDLVWELVLAEPKITQPVFCNFDERGRLWVVEYRQYPSPAGLTPVSKDDFQRTVYDKIPLPPPHGVKGADRISIHEDTNGDGTFDKHSIFVDGLNICTAVEHGRGGHFVLNPPYLLFYPDQNGDDIPDADPDVLLAGFGIEDTHSVANSLRWGPDGWLYGAHGSTVTSHISRPGLDTHPIAHMMGQGIWRYHPASRRFEIFAEGGGNTFGVEFDAQGRVFSGHNGGDTRGFHYMQGAYLQKGFQKHGPLSNPFAFGYFPAMPHPKVERFTHNFIVYEGGGLPEKYEGKLFGIEPLQGRVVLSERIPDGSTFRTRDLGYVVETTDRWFRPVDIKAGPDGAIYVCDFYERVIDHVTSSEGTTDKTNGRIWRLRGKSNPRRAITNLADEDSADLLESLASNNKWERQTALRVLLDRPRLPKDQVVAKTIREPSFPADWHWLLMSFLDAKSPSDLETTCLFHTAPIVRQWSVRALCDQVAVSEAIAQQLVILARDEPDIEVRVQLAASARRLSAAQCLPVVRELLLRDEDADDPRQPLMLWWAIESKCAKVATRGAAGCSRSRRCGSDHSSGTFMLERLMRRFAAAGAREDLLACARLLEMAPTDELAHRLMPGFEAALEGGGSAVLPGELVKAMSARKIVSTALGVRLGDSAATQRGIEILGDPKADASERQRLAQALGEARVLEAMPVLLSTATAQNVDDALRQRALAALGNFDDARIAERILEAYGSFNVPCRMAAQATLASRVAFARLLVREIQIDRIGKDSIDQDTVSRLRRHPDPALAAAAAKLWPESGQAVPEVTDTIRRLTRILDAGHGGPYAGQTIFRAHCATCHRLFGEGGAIGPDLTAFDRRDTGSMLANIVNPSGQIREGYENHLLTTTDGRVLTGFRIESNPDSVALRGLDGQVVTVSKEKIASLEATGTSLMPTGLLTGLDDQALRDLFAYLRSAQPLVPRKGK